jgi:hypothetical protein
MSEVRIADVQLRDGDRLDTKITGRSIKTFGRVKKPNTVQHQIPLNPATPIALKGSIQEKIYLKELAKYKRSVYYQLHQNTETDEYFLTDPNNNIIRGNDLKSVYAFVILEIDGNLELRLGLNNHYFVADRADSVVAAGDIYFTPQKNQPPEMSLNYFGRG